MVKSDVNYIRRQSCEYVFVCSAHLLYTLEIKWRFAVWTAAAKHFLDLWTIVCCQDFCWEEWKPVCSSKADGRFHTKAMKWSFHVRPHTFTEASGWSMCDLNNFQEKKSIIKILPIGNGGELCPDLKYSSCFLYLCLQCHSSQSFGIKAITNLSTFVFLCQNIQSAFWNPLYLDSQDENWKVFQLVGLTLDICTCAEISPSCCCRSGFHWSPKIIC